MKQLRRAPAATVSFAEKAPMLLSLSKTLAFLSPYRPRKTFLPLISSKAISLVRNTHAGAIPHTRYYIILLVSLLQPPGFRLDRRKRKIIFPNVFKIEENPKNLQK